MPIQSNNNINSLFTTVTRQRKCGTMVSVPKPKEPRQAKLIEIVPDGDMFFMVGEGQDALDIKVSSVVVSLASKVFSSMVSSGFSEALTGVVDMTSDDPVIVLAFCKILHHKIDNLDHLDLGQLVKLGELADMRICTTIISPWVTARLERPIEKLNEKSRNFSRWYDNGIWDQDLGVEAKQLLPIARIFKLDGLFSKCTRILISSLNRASIMDPWWESGGENLKESWDGDAIYDAIADASKQYTQTLLNKIFECIEPSFGDLPHGTDCQDRKFGSLYRALGRAGIKQRLEVGGHQTLQSVILSLRAFVRALENDKCKWRGPPCAREVKCKYCCRDFAGDLKRVVNQILDETSGMCLPCFIDGSSLCSSKQCQHREQGEQAQFGV